MRNATHAETLATWLAATTPESIPASAKEMARKLLLDVSGLCVAARRETYVSATLATVDRGPCTAFGHAGGVDDRLAFVNASA